MVELVLGLDGGNSKTDVVIADSNGRLLAHERGPGTRSHVDGVELMVAGLAELVARARLRAGLAPSTTISTGAFYLANLDLPETELAAQHAIVSRGLAERVVVGNDTLAVLNAGAPDGWGVAVVCGAGINAVGVHPDGTVARFLALGDSTGDWGGGWGVAIAGIGAAVRAGDGRGDPTALGTLLAQHFARPSIEDVAVEVATTAIGHEEVTAAAPVVFDAAVQGDAVALAIVGRLADEVVSFVRASYRRLGLEDLATVPVVLGGGLLQHGPPLLIARIRAELARTAPSARPVVLDVPPVAGAVLSAMSSLRLSPDVLSRTRAALVTEARDLHSPV